MLKRVKWALLIMECMAFLLLLPLLIIITPSDILIDYKYDLIERLENTER